LTAGSRAGDDLPASLATGRGLPRPVEAAAALAGLVVLAPVLAAAAVGVRLSSRGPVLFRQRRVGRGGREFTMFKFRTMRIDNAGPGITAGDDTRITRVGRILRQSKLDELPALWNVACGTMSLVGYRPELPRYVDPQDPLWRAMLVARPGLTDPATLALRNEEALLAGVRHDREGCYRRVVQPYKLLLSGAYQQRRSWTSDLRVMRDTLLAIVVPARTPPPTLAQMERAVTAHRARAGAQG